MLFLIQKKDRSHYFFYLLGWWLVSNALGSSGWVPGAYLEKPDGKKEDLVTESAERGKGKLVASFEEVISLLQKY